MIYTTSSRHNLSRFRRLQSRRDTIEQDLSAIIEAAKDSEEKLMCWRRRVPRFFDFEFWSSENRLEEFQQQIEGLPERAKHQAETIILQAATLQLTYDGALIQAHRPLLEQKIPSSCSRTVVDAINQSLEVATPAALRISRIPILRFKHHFADSFASLHQFTAGVILCILPTSQPFTAAAHEAKSGIMRIIHASAALGSHNRIATQTVQLLTELLKVTVEREMSSALKGGLGPYFPRMSEGNTIPSLQSAQKGTAVEDISAPGEALHGGFSTSTFQQPRVRSESIYQQHSTGNQSAQVSIESSGYPFPNIFEQIDDTFGAFGERE